MKTAAEIVDDLGGSTALGADLELPATTVASWKTRRSIPIQHWPALTRLAKARGVTGISMESLMKLALSQTKSEKCA